MIISRIDAIEAWGTHFRIAQDAQGTTTIQESLGSPSNHPAHLQFSTLEDASAALLERFGKENVPVISLADELSVPAVTLGIGQPVYVCTSADSEIEETIIANITITPMELGGYDAVFGYTTADHHFFTSQDEEFKPAYVRYAKAGTFFLTEDAAAAWQDSVIGMRAEMAANM